MKGDFDRAFAIITSKDIEGDYSNDPNDPGGETIRGITKRDHPEAWENGRPTIEQAKAIYQRDYWDAVKGDSLPWPLCLYVFDAAVNQGPTTAVKMLQRSVQTTQDGVIGKQTVNLSVRSSEWHWARFMAFRAMRYQSTKNFDRFGEGWLNRLFLIARKGAMP